MMLTGENRIINAIIFESYTNKHRSIQLRDEGQGTGTAHDTTWFMMVVVIFKSSVHTAL